MEKFVNNVHAHSPWKADQQTINNIAREVEDHFVSLIGAQKWTHNWIITE